MGLFSLLPGRHADFRLVCTIDDITNVPLVSGSFAVEWKFRSKKHLVHDTSHSPAVMNELPSSSGRRGSTSFNHPNSSGNSNDGGASNPRTSQSSSLAPPTAFSTSLTSLVSRGSDSDSDSDSPPPGNEDNAMPPSNLERSSGVTDDGSRLGRVSSKRSSKHSSSTKKLKGDAIRVQDEDGYVVSTRSRGMTDSVEIREHGCVFKHRIDSAVQIGVTSHKDGAQVLEEKILRLVVHEYLSAHDSDKSSGKLGQLSLNLAEYVGKGKTVRRYLLDGSKTNATLKLSIELTQIGGPTKFQPLQISKGLQAGTGLESLVGQRERKVGEVIATAILPSSASTKISEKGRINARLKGQYPGLLADDASGKHHLPFSRSRSPGRTPGCSKPNSRAPSPPGRTREQGVTAMSTKAIIEAIFNPYYSSTCGPFTVPHPSNPSRSNSDPLRAEFMPTADEVAPVPTLRRSSSGRSSKKAASQFSLGVGGDGGGSGGGGSASSKEKGGGWARLRGRPPSGKHEAMRSETIKSVPVTTAGGGGAADGDALGRKANVEREGVRIVEHPPSEQAAEREQEIRKKWGGKGRLTS